MNLVASRSRKHPDTWNVIDADKIPESWGVAEAAGGWPYAAIVESGFKSEELAESWIRQMSALDTSEEEEEEST
jgi:hypothetical protein